MAPKTPIYMDYQATTPLDPKVFTAMQRWFVEGFGNPHSSTHRYGWEAEAAVEEARKSVAGLINADAKSVFFTSGATESNNLAIKGVMEALSAQKPHLIIPVTEHKCVVESAQAVARHGARVTWLPMKPDGLIDLDLLAQALSDDTALVSVMAVNNEIGVIQPVAEIGALCRKAGVYFHCDAAQAFGKIPLDVDGMNIDLMSISGHKIYGPKGIGAIYLRRARPRVRYVPQMAGGGQEGGVRSGTLSPALCVGLGQAASIAKTRMQSDQAHINDLAKRFLHPIEQAFPQVILNGDRHARFWGNINLSFPGVDGDLLLSSLRDLAVSSGAACASATSGPSYVLEAIGRSRKDALSSIRFGIGRFTTPEEIDFAARTVITALTELGWDKKEHGVGAW
ncbi:cysteine desulfurase IscS [Iodidimonas gelatinilytica]|uniref:Cysteine desulfurase n=1 Tax=Iodidimonas gelatinilytica TaxID=1236966 RepID=A0A5A7MZD4_9PROT|nr:aminotransferase class V-fold PLP-dependent enzyme [Iodidimonas gelatinilytica]GER01147.1 cysteine desulfurase IscS [Iodidimonas gelatinilytica]